MAMTTVLEIGGAMVVPVLLALFLPRRWRMEGLLLWLAAPVVVYVVVIVWETVTGPPTPNVLGVALMAMMIGAMVAIPWLVVCGLAFMVGLLLRAFVRRILGLPPEAKGPPPALPLAVPPHWQPASAAPDVKRPDPDGFSR
jgi:hypothetical protein